MITSIREVRRAKKMTLQQVADACKPPTTAQTIGRLETGTRTVSVGWLNRIAAALGVTAGDLVTLPDQADLPVAAELSQAGTHAPRHTQRAAAPVVTPELVAVRVIDSIGDYRSGDVIWATRTRPEDFASALNRDILAPRPAGRFAFGRLIGRDGEKLLLLPPGAGSRQVVITDAPWIAVAKQLVRML